jgi:hypothetical protein
MLPPGSSVSMTNFVPLNGVLIPRSRLSSMNTFSGTGWKSIAPLSSADLSVSALWASGSTQHYLITPSNGSVSVASFVSAAGLGVAGLPSAVRYQYAPVYAAGINQNMLLAAQTGSYNTVLCLYQEGGSASGRPLYSYLTGAPKALAIATFDNYVLAWNIQQVGVQANTRIQWCTRGDPSNWTGEGSGYEDLLAMRGWGSAVRDIGDNRVILFSDLETWYGVRAAYPAQFTFSPLDSSTGCPWPATIQECPEGLLYIASDFRLRLIGRGATASQVIAPALGEILRRFVGRSSFPGSNATWAVFNPRTRLYYLFMGDNSGSLVTRPLVINIDTGEFGFLSFADLPTFGVSWSPASDLFAGNEGVFFISSQTVFSFNSKGPESPVTQTWRSAPLATDLPTNYKQIVEVDFDYRATSPSTLTLKISGDGGVTYESIGRAVTLPVAAIAGRARAQTYVGGALPVLEITSDSTGFELHRLDVAFNVGGRR